MLRGHSGAFTLAGFLLTLAGTAFAQNAGTAAPAHADGILNVGIVRYIRPSPHEPVIEPTIAALKARFGAANVATVTLTMDELTRSIRDKKVDVFIASAVFTALTSSTARATSSRSQAAPTLIPTTATARFL